jgi:hypothetical protein
MAKWARTSGVVWLLASSGCFVPRVSGIDPLKFFQTLDYQQSKIAAEIPEYENHLWKTVEQIRPDLLDTSRKHSPESAMALVYTAFYTGNANYGALSGAISYQELTRFRRFAPHRSDLASELAAREQAAHDLLSLAQQTLPNEPMIKGYLATSHLRAKLDESGELSQDAVEQVVAAAESDPPFNLFSALITLDDFAPRADLRRRIDRVLDVMTSGDGPCDRAIPRRGCFPNLRIVPFAFQGSRVIAGDGYLKRARDRLAADAGDRDGKAYVQRALELYRKLFDRLLFFGAIRKLTGAWPLKAAVQERIDTAQAMLDGKLPAVDFFRSATYKAVYRCASCHSR